MPAMSDRGRRSAEETPMPDPSETPTANSKDSHTGSPTGGYAADASSPTPTVKEEQMSSSPAETTTIRQRAVAYVRESTEEQGQGFSPDAQRETIRKFAVENDLDLIGEYCDFHSGWRKSEARPEFQRLMADAAQGCFGGVLAFPPPRSPRSRSTRCSTSTTPSRSPSGLAAACARRHARATSSATSPGVMCAIPRASSPSPIRSAPRSCERCLSAMPLARSQTAASPTG